MITVYSPLATSFTGNGAATLFPTECKIKRVAGGEYSFTMTHPIDPWGKYQKLVREAVVKLPVPEETIENSFSGMEAWVYDASEELVLRDEPSEPQLITYNTWSSDGQYATGDYVTFNGKNYRNIYFDETSIYATVSPENVAWWSPVPTMTHGGAVVATVKAGKSLYWISGGAEDEWWLMSTFYGVQGYCKQSLLTNERHLEPSQNQPRIITEQLFRIKSVSINRQEGFVEVYGVHVSNDLSGIIVDEVNMVNAPVNMAIGLIVDGFMMDYQGMIATNLDGEQTYTQNIQGKNGIYCLLDKDSGIVPRFNARFTVDNWDLFIMEQTNPDRGYRIRAGKNVKGINWQEKSDGLVTRIMPVAKAEGGENLYLPEKFVDSAHINSYPVIYMERLTVKGQVGKAKNEDESETWTEEDLLDEMRAKAEERFSIDNADLILTEITVDLEPLENTAEYAWLKDLLHVLLYDSVVVQDPEIGLNKTLIVSELEYDAIREVVTGVKLTNCLNAPSRSVTGYNVSNASIGTEKLKDSVIDDLVSNVVDIMPEFNDPSTHSSQINVINNLNSTSTTDALSANMGHELKGMIPDVIEGYTSLSTTDALAAKTGKDLYEYVNEWTVFHYDISVAAGALIEVTHDGFVLLASDRGGMWSDGINGRTLATLASTSAMSCYRSTTNNKVLYIASWVSAASYVMIQTAKNLTYQTVSGFKGEYSDSSTYAQGDKVWYGGALYSANVAISTAEAWDSSHWTQFAG